MQEGVQQWLIYIIYMNFQKRFDIQRMTTEEKFRQKLNDLLPKDRKKVYLLFDEIQVVEGWQRVINGLRVSFDSDIVITGSDAEHAFRRTRHSIKRTLHRDSNLYRSHLKNF